MEEVNNANNNSPQVGGTTAAQDEDVEASTTPTATHDDNPVNADNNSPRERGTMTTNNEDVEASTKPPAAHDDISEAATIPTANRNDVTAPLPANRAQSVEEKMATLRALHENLSERQLRALALLEPEDPSANIPHPCQGDHPSTENGSSIKSTGIDTQP